MLQITHFADGSGFVVHKLEISSGTYSAWFDYYGKLKDAERIVNGRTFPVPTRWTHVRAELEQRGKVIAHTERALREDARRKAAPPMSDEEFRALQDAEASMGG